MFGAIGAMPIGDAAMGIARFVALPNVLAIPEVLAPFLRAWWE